MSCSDQYKAVTICRRTVDRSEPRNIAYRQLLMTQKDERMPCELAKSCDRAVGDVYCRMKKV
jgi:hypothetical protein